MNTRKRILGPILLAALWIPHEATDLSDLPPTKPITITLHHPENSEIEISEGTLKLWLDYLTQEGILIQNRCSNPRLQKIETIPSVIYYFSIPNNASNSPIQFAQCNGNICEITAPDNTILHPAMQHFQMHALSCEAASLTMAISSGLSPTQLELLKQIEENILALTPKAHDPDLGFVGNVNGKQAFPPQNEAEGYGVHPKGIINAVNQVIQEFGLPLKASLINQNEILPQLKNGPIVVWIAHTTIPTSNKFYVAEHAITIIGYVEGSYLILDPLHGYSTIPIDKLEERLIPELDAILIIEREVDSNPENLVERYIAKHYPIAITPP